MLAILQFPLADLREFVGVETGRLRRPAWPLAAPGEDFVRGAGPIRWRSSPFSDPEEWHAEDTYCEAKAALRFPNHLSGLSVGSGKGMRVAIQRVMRRFKSDGVVGRFEVGLVIQGELRAHQISNADVLRFLRNIVGLPVNFRKSTNQALARGAASSVRTPNPRQVPLLQAGPSIAHQLLDSTTRHGNVARAGANQWIVAGAPCLIVQDFAATLDRGDEVPGHMMLGDESVQFVPPHWECLETPGSRLAHSWLQVGAQRFSTWFISGSPHFIDGPRRLRIHLLRLHAERECVRQILIRLHRGELDFANDPVASDAVQRYLNDALRSIERPKRGGFDQCAFLQTASKAVDVVFGGDHSSLRHMRRQVAAKIDAYVKRSHGGAGIVNNIYGDQMSTTIQLGDVTVSGDFTIATAKKIQGSFNKAAARDDQPVAKAVQALAVEVSQLVKHLPEEAAERAARDLDMLATEALSKSPRKKWYELSAAGLIEAAKTVAELAVPVGAAVASVLGLLNG